MKRLGIELNEGKKSTNWLFFLDKMEDLSDNIKISYIHHKYNDEFISKCDVFNVDIKTGRYDVTITSKNKSVFITRRHFVSYVEYPSSVEINLGYGQLLIGGFTKK